MAEGMVIQPRYLDIIRDAADAAVAKSLVTINGEQKEFPIYRTLVDGYKIRKYIYIQNDTGHITNAVLLDHAGNQLAIKPHNVQKGTDGFVICFELEIKLEVK
ncbi:hypothetical protein [Aneurinibacillus migulanus]|uniref:hypothetical protein n=1 Tax=Aneurinibacillus migulanus TaxID=47500 RepID=UPI0020A0B246|nr:hypothetical protein [Aneurinibacillus migulanus]MCP1358775.1 hypothetical protein [Aneurinibacillus migulanus]